MSALQGEAHFFEESMNPMKVKEYLSRPKVKRGQNLVFTSSTMIECAAGAGRAAEDALPLPHARLQISEA